MGVSHLRRKAVFNSLAAARVSNNPTARPIPISSTTSLIASVQGPASPALSSASARNTNRMGTQMPSFRPLSTFRPWRISSGTDSLVTTALPSAASVGASMVASRAMVNRDRLSTSSTPTPKPSTMVNGRPISSNRAGSPAVFFNTLMSAPAASVNSTIASVTSARLRIVSPSVSHDSRSRPRGPTSRPKQVNTIGPLIQVRSTAPATEL